VSAARARRRLMAFERYRQRAEAVGGFHPDAYWGLVTDGHSRAWAQVDQQMRYARRRSRDVAWVGHRCPWTPVGRCPYQPRRPR